MTNYFKYQKEIKCIDTGELCKGYNEYLKSNHWKSFRTKILDGIKCCCVCEEKGNIYHVHHLKYDNLGKETIKDVRVVCPKCHKLTHKLDMEIDCLQNEYKNSNKKQQQFVCEKCGSKKYFFKTYLHNKGVFCKKCGKWIKWLNKEEKRQLML